MAEQDPNRTESRSGAAVDRDAVNNARKLASELGVDLDTEHPGWDNDAARLGGIVSQLLQRIGAGKGTPREASAEELERVKALADKQGVPLPDDWSSDHRTTQAVRETAERAARGKDTRPKRN